MKTYTNRPTLPAGISIQDAIAQATGSSFLKFLAVLTLVTVCAAPIARAQSSWWTNTAAGSFNWGDTNNWSNSVVANGQGNIAYFTNTMQGDVTVHVDQGFMTNYGGVIGSIWLGNTSTPYNWTIDNGGGATNVLTLNATSGARSTIQCVAGQTNTISCVIAGTNAIQRMTGNVLILSGSNTFSGQIFFYVGTNIVSSFGDVNGIPSNLGQPSSAANAVIGMANANSSAALIYQGPGETTDRQIQIGLSSSGNGSATIENDGTGPLNFSTTPFNVKFTTMTVARNLILQGSYSGNNTISGAIQNNSSGNIGVNVKGGTWAFAGVNTYSSPTTISNATLILSGTGTIGSGAVTILSGGTFLVNGQVGTGGITVLAGGTLGGIGTNLAGVTFQDNSTVLFTNGATLTINGALTADATVVVDLNLSNNVPVGTNVLATFGSGAPVFASTPTILSGSFAAGTTNFIATISTNVCLVVQSITLGPPSATNITYSVSAGDLILNWPNNQGWQLEAQTNGLNVGLGTNWTIITGATSPFTNNIDPNNPTVFYRLQYP